MTLPNFADGHVIIDDEWNAHANAINANTNDVASLIDKPHARYYRTSSQTIPTGEDTKVQFATALNTHDDVTASGTGNTDFTLNRSGIWCIDAGARFAGDTGGGERALNISQSGDLFYRYAGQSGYPASGVMSIESSTSRRFNAGDAVSVICYQASGNPLDLIVSFQENIYVALTWVGP